MASDGALRQVEERIERARREKAGKLDLSELGLTEFPDSLAELTQLQSLDLSHNQLAVLPESLGQLTRLQSLNVAYNQLAMLPEGLGQLTRLHSLNVRNNQLLMLPERLGQLTQLQRLPLSGNRLTSLPGSLRQLTQLQQLYLSGNQLTTFPESVSELTQLGTLTLWGNQLTVLPESLGQLTRLQRLDVSGNQLRTLPESLGQLTRLQSLDASVNQLTVLPEWLGQLTQLESLDASVNQLTVLPEWLGQLTQLQRLSVSDNRLMALPESLGQLTQLQTLSASKNRLKALPESLGPLTRLQSLDVSNNQLILLPESLGELTQLQRLTASDNQLMALPESLGKLTQLRRLGASGNQLAALPESLGQLTQLQELGVSSNQLTALPESLGQLNQLQALDVSGNQLKTLPEWLWRLARSVSLYLEDNLPLGLPTEIIESHDSRKIADYYFRAVTPGARHALNEFKLILVGRGGVGKTTLVHRLVRGKFKEFKRTPGINITRWPMTIGGKAVRAHAWDFGGQEILHGTHRFFMTERALYLILISGREGTEDHDAEYWLSLVRSFAGDVPVIVLLNKWDDFHFELDREQLCRKYGQDLVFLETDAKTGRGIYRLDQHIRRLAKKLPGLKAAWPAAWHQIKTQLPEKKRNYLTFDQFCAFCRRCGITNRTDQEALVESLHDLGLMLAYRRDDALRDIGVLNPVWVTQGIYRMLTAPALRDAGGEFTVKTFREVLPLRKYPSGLHPYLLALMRKFRLCHPLDDKGERHLIPQLLTKQEEPTLDADFPANQCLGFTYRYDAVLPEGLFPRFIVETYVHSEPKLVWRTGVVLHRANCRALVRGDVQGRKVTIRVTGPGGGRRELLGIIREHFERIHGSYEKLPVTEVVPIPGYAEADVEHELLLTYERERRDTITVKVGNELRDFPVKQLLDGVDLPGVSRVLERERIRGEGRLSLFISYSHKDERFRDGLAGALLAYERKGELVVWDDTKIVPGQKWEPEILAKLERADIIVLLLSNDFIRSDYCVQKEMKRAIERDSADECAIVPIVVRSCRFDKLDVGKIQAILPNGKPIKGHKDRDAAWLEVTRQLDRVLERLRKRHADGRPPRLDT